MMGEQRGMRILLVATGLKVGGAEHQVVALAGAFRALGHAVAIVSLSPGCEIDVPPGVDVIELGMRKTPAGLALALWRARTFVRAWRPDVMHAHMMHANLFARLLTRIARCPLLVCTAHSYREGGRARMLAYRLTDRWCALTTHVSEAGRAGMIAAGAVPAARIVVMPNGIDIARFRHDAERRARTRASLGIDDGAPLLMHVGRLVPAKAQHVLVAAFVRSRDKRAKLLIAGGGPLADTLAAQIHVLQLDGRVRLLGPRHDVPALLDAADAFALSSHIEGSPLVLAEALASGCPVVSTDAPGVREIVDGLGIIVPRGDAEALARAIDATLAEGRGDAPTQAARRAHVRATRALDAIAHRWLVCYATLRASARDSRLDAA